MDEAEFARLRGLITQAPTTGTTGSCSGRIATTRGSIMAERDGVAGFPRRYSRAERGRVGWRPVGALELEREESHRSSVSRLGPNGVKPA
jgi:hypothetical protein